MRIVYYHMISDSKFDFFNGFTVSKKKFENDVIHYKNYFNVITFKEVYEYLKDGKSIKDALVITFDDGYKENFLNAKSILDKHKLKATFFLNSSTIDNRNFMWRDALTYLNNKIDDKRILNSFKNDIFNKSNDFDLLKSTKNLPLNNVLESIDKFWDKAVGINIQKFLDDFKIYISSNDVKLLIESGYEIGVHSNQHPNFSILNFEQAVFEVMTAYNFFSKEFNYEPISMSFPFGCKYPESDFYDFILKNTSIKYFSGINYNYLSNRNLTNNFFVERLGMEDGRNFFISFYLRPLIRLFK